MSLFRLVFASDAVGAAADALLPLIDIIGVSHANNRRDHITSVLLRHDSRFFQVMEGARVDLDRTFSRIRYDRRHTDVRLLCVRAVEARLFPDCPMARIDATPALDRLICAGLAPQKTGPMLEQLMAEAHRAASPAV
nr:BLUF domain-containing protein [uncultured Brevundimonas sp.]